MQQLVDDLVERRELAVGKGVQRIELLRLGALLHGVLEQPRLVGRQLDTDKRGLELGNGRGVHGAFLPGPDREKRMYA